jgi:hypothetical protein
VTRLDARGRRLRAALAAVLVPDNAPEVLRAWFVGGRRADRSRHVALEFHRELAEHGVGRSIAVFFYGRSLWACLRELGAFDANQGLCGSAENDLATPRRHANYSNLARDAPCWVTTTISCGISLRLVLSASRLPRTS